MGKEEPIRVQGTVKQALPNARFKVELDDEGEGEESHEVLAHEIGRASCRERVHCEV